MLDGEIINVDDSLTALKTDVPTSLDHQREEDSLPQLMLGVRIGSGQLFIVHNNDSLSRMRPWIETRLMDGAVQRPVVVVAVGRQKLCRRQCCDGVQKLRSALTGCVCDVPQ